MPYCTQCRNETQPNAKYCGYCGKQLRFDSTPAQRSSDYGVGDLVEDVVDTAITIAVIDTVGDVLSSIFD